MNRTLLTSLIILALVLQITGPIRVVHALRPQRHLAVIRRVALYLASISITTGFLLAAIVLSLIFGTTSDARWLTQALAWIWVTMTGVQGFMGWHVGRYLRRRERGPLE